MAVETPISCAPIRLPGTEASKKWLKRRESIPPELQLDVIQLSRRPYNVKYSVYWLLRFEAEYFDLRGIEVVDRCSSSEAGCWVAPDAQRAATRGPFQDGLL